MPFTKLLELTSSKYTLSMLILIFQNPNINLTQIREKLNIENAKSVGRSRDILLEFNLITEYKEWPNVYRLTITKKGSEIAEWVIKLVDLLQ